MITTHELYIDYTLAMLFTRRAVIEFVGMLSLSSSPTFSIATPGGRENDHWSKKTLFRVRGTYKRQVSSEFPNGAQPCPETLWG